MMKSGTRELGIAERFAAGSVAGVFSQTAIYPLEVCYLLFITHLFLVLVFMLMRMIDAVYGLSSYCHHKLAILDLIWLLVGC